MNKFVSHVRQIYRIAQELEDLTGRRFTPDGHMVGSIGEVLASWHYDLDLMPPSTEAFDARAKNGVRVQIKATQGDRIALSSMPDRLLVLRLDRNGKFEEVFNGRGELAWKHAGKRQKNGQRQMSLAKLKRIMEHVPVEARLERRANRGPMK